MVYESYRLYVFGGRGRTRTFLILFVIIFFKKNCVFFVGIRWSTGPIGTRPRVRPLWSPPTHHDLMKIYWVYHPDSTLAQRVGMVAVGTTTLAQRRHGRRRHNYGAATSFSQRWANIFCQPYANDVGHVGKNKKCKYLFFDFLRT